MNEQIKELEKQAFDAVWNLYNYPIGPGTHFRPDGFEEKFAELIAYECINLALGSSHREDDMGAIIANKIKKHFGVDE